MRYFVLAFLVGIEAMDNRTHMSNCLPAVRSFVAEGGDSVDWLFEQANDDADVVLLYMIRMCFFFHKRDDHQQYDCGALFSKVTGTVPSFDQSHFSLLNEAVRGEIVSGKPYEELFNKEDARWSLSAPTAIVVGLLGLTSMLFFRKRCVIQNRPKVE